MIKSPVAAFVVLLSYCASTHAVDLYQTDFSNPPFVGGPDTWAGTDGWISNDTTSGVQGITAGSAFLGGINAATPAGFDTWVWQPLSYDPLAEGNPIVNMTMDLNISDSTNAEYDFFQVQIYNSLGTFLGGIDFDNNTLGISRLDGALLSSTGVDFMNDEFQTLSFEINFADNVWSASWGASVLFTAAEFNATSGVLDLGELDFYWGIQSPGSPGDNYLLVDNLLVQAVPEPTAFALCALGLGLLATHSRKRQSRRMA